VDAVIPFISASLGGAARPKLDESSAPAQVVSGHHDPPEVAWLDPELADGAEFGLPRLPELELPVLELPVLELPDPLDWRLDEPEPGEPELPEPFEADEPEEPEEEDPAPFEAPDEEPADDPDPEDDAAVVWAEPGSVNATVPAATRLATPTAAVVALMRLRPRSRAATAHATVSRSWVLMP
jgi:hypothetical protein